MKRPARSLSTVQNTVQSRCRYLSLTVFSLSTLTWIGATLTSVGTIALPTLRPALAETLAPGQALTMRSDVQEANSITGVITARGECANQLSGASDSGDLCSSAILQPRKAHYPHGQCLCPPRRQQPPGRNYHLSD